MVLPSCLHPRHLPRYIDFIRLWPWSNSHGRLLAIPFLLINVHTRLPNAASGPGRLRARRGHLPGPHTMQSSHVNTPSLQSSLSLSLSNQPMPTTSMYIR